MFFVKGFVEGFVEGAPCFFPPGFFFGVATAPPAAGLCVGGGVDTCALCAVLAVGAAGFFFLGVFAKLTVPSDSASAHAASGATKRETRWRR